eukprot:5299900-Pleurochrysis_carterae.AAC.2
MNACTHKPHYSASSTHRHSIEHSRVTGINEQAAQATTHLQPIKHVTGVTGQLIGRQNCIFRNFAVGRTAAAHIYPRSLRERFPNKHTNLKMFQLRKLASQGLSLCMKSAS